MATNFEFILMQSEFPTATDPNSEFLHAIDFPILKSRRNYDTMQMHVTRVAGARGARVRILSLRVTHGAPEFRFADA